MATCDHLLRFLSRLNRRSPLTDEENATFLSLPHREVAFERGAFLLREGDPTERCFVLLSGFAYCQRSTRRGARQILAFHIPGDPLDFQNSLFGQADHSVQTLTPARAALIARSEVEQLVTAFPNLGRALWRDTLAEGSILREWLLSLGQRDAIQRLAHLFCEMAVRQEQAGVSRLPDIHWPMTQEDIGNATGLTAVHVNRTLRRMREENIVSVAHGSATILNWPALKDIAEFDGSYLHPKTVA